MKRFQELQSEIQAHAVGLVQEYRQKGGKIFYEEMILEGVVRAIRKDESGFRVGPFWLRFGVDSGPFTLRKGQVIRARVRLNSAWPGSGWCEEWKVLRQAPEEPAATKASEPRAKAKARSAL